MIAEKTNEVWPDSYQKVEQIIDQYKNMSIRGWIKLIYNFTNEIIRSINKQTTCGYELDYSNIVDVLIETANFRWILKTEHTSSMFEPIQHYNTDFELSKTRVLSTTPTQIYDNTTKTVLSFIKNL
jgi:F0F1-type ATP synthase gamma subunit